MMTRRLLILSGIMVGGLVAMALLGFHALDKWQQGLAGTRLAEFTRTAESIRAEVSQSLDTFREREAARPYTDYLYYHVAATPGQAEFNMRSSLSGRLDHDLAYGHFQIEADGTILTPNDDILEREGENTNNFQVEGGNQVVRAEVKEKVLPLFTEPASPVKQEEDTDGQFMSKITWDNLVQSAPVVPKVQPNQSSKSKRSMKTLSVDSLTPQSQQTQVIEIERSLITSNSAVAEGQRLQQRMVPQTQAKVSPRSDVSQDAVPVQKEDLSDNAQTAMAEMQQQFEEKQRPVKVRIEPFVPILSPQTDDTESIFGGAVYLLRHVQVEARHFIQGFRLNETKLLDMVQAAARRFVQPGMTYTLSASESAAPGHQTVLDFGFGEIVLCLSETNPGRIAQRVLWLRRWYEAVLVIVSVAVLLGLLSLWRGARQQVQLARKKDDFISAVSHELRTPLTSIRMYAEMLEQGWVASPEKEKAYYGHIRQESERLSRLIENVLDFSRIQQGRKQYRLKMGDINTCVQNVVDMMAPYAADQGFTLETQLAAGAELSFDRDAVTQMVVNLVDNAVKYARQATDRTVCIRTFVDDQYGYIEVEDRGPGVPHAQRQKIFEQFYRTEDESTRQTQGTGLGLALVKRFAEAHQGFVKLRRAQPNGAIFTVALARTG